MVRAYVTIMMGASTSREVLTQVRDLGAVEQADIVAGESDIIATVKTESERTLLTLVTDEIQSLPCVGRTSTCIVLE